MSDPLVSGKTQKNIGRGQVRTAADPNARTPWPLSNEVRLKMSKAGAKNLLEGTMRENRKKKKKKRKAKSPEYPRKGDLERIGTNERGENIVQTRRETVKEAYENAE